MITYEPKENTSLDKCVDLTRYNEIVDKIKVDERLSSNQKLYLTLLASRLIDFKFSKIADYYTQAPSYIRDYLENMHLVIMDIDEAIEKGYFKYFEELDKLKAEVVDEE